MTKIYKKIPIALLLSIAIHVIVVTILYINFSKNDSNKSTAESTERILFNKNSDKQFFDESPRSDKFVQTADDETDDNEPKLMTLTKVKEVSRPADEIETNPDIAALVKVNKGLEQAQPNRELVNRNENTLSNNPINDLNLLSTDMPNNRSESEQTKNADSLETSKAEVEDINDQLSTAINEVKNRNQQKIDQLRQDQNYSPNN